MITAEFPTAERTDAISSGEHTIAPAPAEVATLAKETAEFSAFDAKPTSCTSCSDSEVRIVTPVIKVLGIASTAALTIA